MRIVITGGTGLIGSLMTRRYTAQGHDVVVLTRSPEKHENWLPEGATAVKWDGKSSTGWGHHADGADAIINLAGENLSGGRWTPARKERIRASRMNAGAAVTQAVKEASSKPGVVIQSSGINYYGSVHEQTVDESFPPGNDFLSRVCIEWEASTAQVEIEGVRRAVIRTAMVLSNRGGALPLMALPFRLFIGGRVGSGRQPVAWIHIEDVVAGVMHLIENDDAAGAYNFCSPHTVSNKAFTDALSRTMRRPGRMIAPAFALKLALGEMSTVVLSGQNAIPKQLLASGYTFKYEHIGDALRNLMR